MNQYKVVIQVGKRSVTLNLYSRTVDDVRAFCDQNLYGKVKSVYRIEYEAPDSTVYPVDDTSQYKGVMYFLARSEVDKAIRSIPLHLVKNSRNVDSVFASMQQYLGISSTVEIGSLVSAKISQK